MRFRTDLGVFKPSVQALVRYASGSAYANFRHAEMKAEGGLLKLTMTTQSGTAFLTCDADIEVEGEVGVDLTMLAKLLKPMRGKGWEMEVRFDFDPKTEGRQVFAVAFTENGCKRTRTTWPYTGRNGEVFTSSEWVPGPILPSGVIREFTAPRPRLLELLQAGSAAHSQVEKSVGELHSAGITVAADMAAAYSLNAYWGTRAQLWADGDLGFSTGWEGEPETVFLDAEALRRACGVIDAFSGVDLWTVQIPEKGPIRFCPTASPTEAWVLVPQAQSLADLPQMLDEVRACSGSQAGLTKVTGSVVLNRSTGGHPRNLITDLETLSAYTAADPDAYIWTVAFEEDALVVEVVSSLHIGAGVRIPWKEAPPRPLVRSVQGRFLVGALKAITTSSEPDAEIQLTFWASDSMDLERFYFQTASEKGEAADCLVVPIERAGGPIRLSERERILSLSEVAA